MNWNEVTTIEVQGEILVVKDAMAMPLKPYVPANPLDRWPGLFQTSTRVSFELHKVFLANSGDQI